MIHAIIWQKVTVTILVFTTAPGGREFQAVFGTTGQTGYLLLFLFMRGKKKKKKNNNTVRVVAGGADI